MKIGETAKAIKWLHQIPDIKDRATCVLKCVKPDIPSTSISNAIYTSCAYSSEIERLVKKYHNIIELKFKNPITDEFLTFEIEECHGGILQLKVWPPLFLGKNNFFPLFRGRSLDRLEDSILYHLSSIVKHGLTIGNIQIPLETLRKIHASNRMVPTV